MSYRCKETLVCGMFVKCALFHYVVYIIDAGKEKHTESLN